MKKFFQKNRTRIFLGLVLLVPRLVANVLAQGIEVNLPEPSALATVCMVLLGLLFGAYISNAFPLEVKEIKDRLAHGDDD